jgi:DNA-binding HxlR family transcriptional regulator
VVGLLNSVNRILGPFQPQLDLIVTTQWAYTYLMVTKLSAEAFTFCNSMTAAEDQLAREVLEKVTEKWPLSVLRVLAEANGPLRFSRVLERVAGVSQKVLTQTLRTLERDGVISRTLFPQIPPRVEYELTALGAALLAQVVPLWSWIAGRHADFAAARDSRQDSQ